MNTIFAPGCDLRKSKKELVTTFENYLVANHGCSTDILKCCRIKSDYGENIRIITACPGCHETYIQKCANTVSLWEIIDNDENYKFKDYNKKEFSIHDPCVFKEGDMKKQFDLIRNLANKMNIKIIEPKKTKKNTECCGEIYINELSEDEVLEKMKDRANQMPSNDVLVYCMGCYDSMKKAGKNPVHIMELL